MAGAGTKRIVDLTETSEVQSGDYIAIDSTARGTKKTPVSVFAKAADLTAEQTARQQADTTLDGKITAEAQARTEAITAEQTAREEADDALTESVTALSGKVDEQGALIQNPTKTVSGAVAHFTDGADMPAKSVIVNIEPQQSGTGTPSPDNVRQISGWESVVLTDAGKNIVDWTITEQTFTSAFNGFGQNKWQGKMPIPPTWYGKTFTYSAYIEAGSVSSQRVRVWLYNGDTFLSPTKDGNPIVANANGTSSVTLTIPSDGSANMIAFGLGVNDAKVSRPQVEIESSVSDYEPHEGSVYNVDLGQTVPGGAVSLIDGELTKTMTIKKLNEFSWNRITNGSVYLFSTYFDATVRGAANSIISSYYTPQNSSGYGLSDKHCARAETSQALYIRDDSYLTVEDFLAGVGEQQICYELATPTTYQLTPTEVKTLLGENNVWADAGGVSITYRRDINLALEQLEALLNSTETASQTAQPTASTAETSEA